MTVYPFLDANSRPDLGLVHGRLHQFLMKHQDDLAALLETLAMPELAQRLSSYSGEPPFDHAELSEIARDLTDAHECLREAPFRPDTSWEREWSDLDAALLWYGARLDELCNLIWEAHGSGASVTRRVL